MAKLEQRKAQLAADGLPVQPIETQIKQLQAGVAKARTKRDKDALGAKAGQDETFAAAEATRQDHALNEGADKATARLSGAAEAQLKLVPEGPGKDALSAQLTALKAQAAKAEKTTDPSREGQAADGHGQGSARPAEGCGRRIARPGPGQEGRSGGVPGRPEREVPASRSA